MFTQEAKVMRRIDAPKEESTCSHMKQKKCDV